MLNDTPYLTTFYNMLFHPMQSFRALGQGGNISNRLMFQALLTVIFVSGIGPVIHFVGEGGVLSRLLYEVPVQAVAGVFVWIIAASVISLIAYAFTGHGKIRVLLALSAFATLPWILMGPASLFQASAGIVGAFMGAVADLLIWLWTVVLFGLAIANTYKLSAERTVIVLLMPFTMSLIFVSWLAGFAVNIRRFWPE